MPEIERLDTGDDIIVCEGVKKWFGEFQALRGISLRVRRGEVLVVIGPSGSASRLSSDHQPPGRTPGRPNHRRRDRADPRRTQHRRHPQ
jgi:hypothetical protein